MKTFHLTLAAIAALLTTTAVATAAFAGPDCPHARAQATINAAADAAGDALQDDVQVAAVDDVDGQSGADTVADADTPAAEPASDDAVPPAEDATVTTEDSADAADQPASGDEHVTAQTETHDDGSKRVCRKFSAAIATVIEVPCE